MSLRIDLEKTLEYAEGLYMQIKNFKNLPANICEILGFPVAEKTKDEELDALEDTLVNTTSSKNRDPSTSSTRSSKAQTPSDDVSASAAAASSSSSSSGSINRSKLSSNNVSGLSQSVSATNTSTSAQTNNMSRSSRSSAQQCSFKNGDDSIEILN